MKAMFLKITSIAKLKNKYIVRSRFSETKFREILKYFAEDIEASKISNLTKISEATLCKIFREIRALMSKECEKISKFSGEIEIDESYFGSKRVRGLVFVLSLRKEVEEQVESNRYFYFATLIAVNRRYA